MAKSLPFIAEIKTLSGEEHTVMFSAFNKMDAINKLISGGFAIAKNGMIVLTPSIESFSIEKLEEKNLNLFEKFKTENVELLNDLRLYDAI